jgi:RimJ/RimL family protein N-acetyltransferase
MIKGSSIVLTPIIPGDFQALFRWANDIEIARLNEAYRPTDWASHQEWWSNIGKDQTKVIFAIRAEDAGAIIGYVQILNVSPVHRSATLGIRIGDEANRGKGHGSEAIRLALAYCWNDLNLSRLMLNVFESNQRAIKLYESLGFVREGLLRRAVFIDGKWIDVVLMAIHHPSRDAD